MKQCLKCGHSYSDETLNFCLNDGELLVQKEGLEDFPMRFADDTPPTILMNQPRVTNPVDWNQSAPMQWQNQGIAPTGQQQHAIAGFGRTLDSTLPTLSLILGIISCLLVCCAGGIWLGLPAVIVGFIALRNIETNPARYTGRGIAIGGMVLGIVTFLASVFFLIFGQLS